MWQKATAQINHRRFELVYVSEFKQGTGGYARWFPFFYFFLPDFAFGMNIRHWSAYFELKFELERIFKRKIDLLEQKALRNKTFENLVNKQKLLVYARRNQSVA